MPPQDSFPEEAFQECYAMKHEEVLCVMDEMKVTRSEKTGRLNMSEATPSCIGQRRSVYCVHIWTRCKGNGRHKEKEELKRSERWSRVDGHCYGRKYEAEARNVRED